MQTEPHLRSAVEHLLALKPRPDVVVITGDLVEDGSKEEYECFAEILAPLKAKIPVYVAPGNHDERAAMREVLRSAGHEYLPDGAHLQYQVDLGELRLVSLDTVVPGKPGGHLCEERLAWLDQTLAESSKPTIVMQHHPPFLTGLVRMDGMGLSNADQGAAVISKHSHVQRVLSGHLHRSITTGFAGTVALTAPSCAHAVELDLQTTGRLAVLREPPAACLHLWQDGILVSHTSYIGDYGPAYVIEE